ncbi:MAG: hypothetical protein JW774_10345 [Candidatus Aureabacteria bacterium]|nr:hypothetical protein [Candidatus Auribacterota bacterium]
MKTGKDWFIISFILSLVFITGCAVTGSTSSFVLKPGAAMADSRAAKINVSSVELEKDASRLENVGVFSWGKYDSKDVGIFSKSLKDSMAGAQSAQKIEAGKILNVYVIIRTFMVASSNTGGAALACVAWAAADTDNNLIYHEQFYASDSVKLIGTLGGLKNGLNKAIARRIVETSLKLADLDRTQAVEEQPFEKTYGSFDKATERLPKQMTSMYQNNFVFGNPYHVTATLSSGIAWNWSEHPDNVNWEEYLNKNQ